MQRLYLQFYATILLVLAVFVGAALLTWRLAEGQTPQYMEVAAGLTGALLPDAAAPQGGEPKALVARRRNLRFVLSPSRHACRQPTLGGTPTPSPATHA